jgi:opacity protein-like surface antigen
LTSTPTWQFGWVAGLGAEARLFDTNWLARLEYLHYDFGNTGSSFASSFAGAVSSRSGGDLTLDVVRAGLSYKFDPDPFAVGVPVASGGALVYKAKAPVTLPWTWSGVYLGGHAGYGWASDPFNNLTLQYGNAPFGFLLRSGAPLSGLDSRGFVGGFQAGANWQSGSFVGGLEIDLSGTGIKGSTSNSVTAAGTLSQASQSDKFDRLGSARARVGYLVTPGLLLYATGGPGWARLVTDQETVTTVTGAVPPTTTTSLVMPSWLFGWTAGAGVEARLWNTNWLARLEYLHYDFGSGFSTQTIPVRGITTATTSGHLTTDLVRAGLSYKFDWFGMGGGAHGSSAYNAMAAMPPAAAVWSWTGFYIGGHGGYGWGSDPFNRFLALTQPSFQAVSPPIVLKGVDSKGFVGGFQAGANWQAGSVVGGMEIDLSGGDFKGFGSVSGITQIGGSLAATQTDKFDMLGSARGRLGYLVWPSVLLYGTGGLAWTRLEQSVTTTESSTFFPAFTTITTMSSWRFGWVAGAGGEARLWNTNWLARLEYLHYDFGNSGNLTATFTAGTAIDSIVASTTWSRHLTADVVRAGVDYKFD